VVDVVPVDVVELVDSVDVVELVDSVDVVELVDSVDVVELVDSVDVVEVVVVVGVTQNTEWLTIGISPPPLSGEMRPVSPVVPAAP
jgi:hypothetical protein